MLAFSNWIHDCALHDSCGSSWQSVAGIARREAKPSKPAFSRRARFYGENMPRFLK
jgi:hypothetical protein